MPDLDQLIKDGMDRLGERPDPARVLQEVGRRKRQLRVMHRVQTVALVAFVLAGIGGGMYALTRAFGLGTGHPVPAASTLQPSVPPTTSPSPRGTTPTPSPSGTTAVGPCSGASARVQVASTQGAAGTISTLWRITNTAAAPCRSFGYPEMGFHTSSGWLDVR